MNVPEIGDSAHGSRYFQPTNNRFGGTFASRRRRLFVGSAAKPSPTARIRPLRNPGFFHDDRFDDIPENSTIQQSTPPHNVAAEKCEKGHLPAAVRGKKIASRLSIVNNTEV